MEDHDVETLLRRCSCSESAVPQLVSFAAWLRGADYSPHTIRKCVGSAAHFCSWAERHGCNVSGLDDGKLQQFRWHLSRCRCSRRRRGRSWEAFRGAQLFLAHLRGVDAATAVRPDRAPCFTGASERFRLWMARHRGFATVTLLNYLRALRPFLAALGEDPATYSAARIRDFVVEQLGGRSRDHVKRSVVAIRAYLRFLVAEGAVPEGLVHCVSSVPQWRLCSLPRHLESADLQRVIDSCDPATTKGLRDRAILLLLARLGLRAADIVAMRVADVDFRRGCFRVCGKGRREALLPLPQDVGDALLAYLQVRPPSSTDRMFVTARAPIRTFGGPAVVSMIVAAALRRADIRDVTSRGAHLLRHSAATAMLRAGSSLDAIAAVLRHRSHETTAIYAKVDVGALQRVTQPWPPGGASC